jgi:hypothetical protein
MEKVIVPVEKFKSKDGKIFDTEEQCIHHEEIRDGIRKICPSCLGSKKVDPYGDGRVFHSCTQCGGKGYVKKQESWG